MKLQRGLLLLVATAFMLLLVWLTWATLRSVFVSKSPFPLANRTRYLCLTTTPKRLKDPFKIFERLEKLTKLRGHDGVVLSVPWIFSKTSEAYEIPKSLWGLPRLRIYRCDDEGPGTKALAPLRNRELSEDSVLMFCDDDITYAKDSFEVLSQEILRRPYEAHAMCSRSIQGYLGFGGVKDLLLPILQIEMPGVCRSIDDTFFTEALMQLGISINRVTIPGCSIGCELCALDGPFGLAESLAEGFTDKTGLFHQEVLSSNQRKSNTRECQKQLRGSEEEQ